ncbi:glutamate--tRNA ligase [Petrocella sp. FN5]|uniref:glutamate--tRNA ligase n=1 Tax=Petrocella sp. FN5 TaxID=3032002 RepID=UPI0023DC9F93|nr:glutamate--tRNA ligase [Petrocella sp. FN5]MDF1618328.1 glutamate--tRNA ligase [Petrocella sp. FN5]
MSKIRTRFAPSPTGRMHVGNLRTALYAYLIAKHEGGDFLLRIEDTDQERLVEGAIEIINRTMEGTGLIHDEGPDKDGGFGPYIQSERVQAGIYKEHAMKLLDKGEAYYCFCDKERLEQLRKTAEENKENFKYDKHCLDLTMDEIAEKLDADIPYVIRQNNPTKGKTIFKDVIYGDISVDNIELDDMVLMKSDGFPTYNFANVVDDHLMEITHVVRGNEYLSSSPKYNRLYEAFGWDVPTYVHVPLITDENHKKLSKRSGHSSYEDLVEEGFLKDTIVNFIVLLGWSPSDNREIFTLEELVEAFDYRHINKAPAVFDIKKFTWMNGEYIKNMDEATFLSYAMKEIDKVLFNNHLDKKTIALLTQPRIEKFNEIPNMIDFFEKVPEYHIDMYNHKRMKTSPQTALEDLPLLLPILEAHETWTIESLHDLVMAFVEEKGMKNGRILWPLRTILSGKESTPGGAFDIAAILGKEESIKRIRIGLEKLKNDLDNMKA